MSVSIASGQRLSPNAFQDVQTVTGMTTTTATSESHGQTLDPDIQVSVLAGGTEVAIVNTYQLADGLQGQEKWITMASATGLSFIALSLATHEFLETSTATQTYTPTTGIVMGAADDSDLGLKFVGTSWKMLYHQGTTPATASSPFA